MDKKFHLNYNSIALIILCVIICVVFCTMKQCDFNSEQKQIISDTVNTVKIVERPVFIKDTVKIKSVMWKYNDTTIFVDKKIPCGDTSFVAQADSVLIPTGDTLNLAFSYSQGFGNFSLVYRPRPDSIITQTIDNKIYIEKEITNHGWTFGAFGIGILIGIFAGIAK